MDIGILGTGDVGRTLATALVRAGHRVRLGSRTADNAAAAAWVDAVGERGSQGTFADAAGFGELVLLCVGGRVALDVVAATDGNLDGKVVIDVTNPLDFSNGFPPSLTVCNTDSLGETIQRALPGARVVKALNTLANPLMLDPAALPEPTTLLICGDDADAKGAVRALLESFGWQDIVDVGPISASRGTEAWLLLWTRLYGALGTASFNLKLVRA